MYLSAIHIRRPPFCCAIPETRVQSTQQICRKPLFQARVSLIEYCLDQSLYLTQLLPESLSHLPSIPLLLYSSSTMASGSSTAASNHVYLSDMDDSIFLKRTRRVFWVQLSLSVLILAVTVAIVVCEAMPLHHYKSTSQWAKLGLALWPLNFDIRPTIAALSSGCLVTFLTLVHIAVIHLPSVSTYSGLLLIDGN